MFDGDVVDLVDGLGGSEVRQVFVGGAWRGEVGGHAGGAVGHEMRPGTAVSGDIVTDAFDAVEGIRMAGKRAEEQMMCWAVNGGNIVMTGPGICGLILVAGIGAVHV